MAHLSRMSTACSAHYIRYLLSKSCCSTEPHWVDWWASIFWKIFPCWISNAASFWPAQGKPHLSSPPLPTPERLPYQLLSSTWPRWCTKPLGDGCIFMAISVISLEQVPGFILFLFLPLLPSPPPSLFFRPIFWKSIINTTVHYCRPHDPLTWKPQTWILSIRTPVSVQAIC